MAAQPSKGGEPIAAAYSALGPPAGEQQSGLTAAEAARRLARYGPNEPTPPHRAGPLIQFLRFCTNPLVLILLIASAVSATVGDAADAAIIAAVVALSVILNFFQAYRSEQAVRRLRERVAPTATVLRDNRWLELPRRDVVPGDVIRLSAGDLVPADARLITSRDLHVQQAALTGESIPVEKGAPQSAAPDADKDADLVFLGTSVASGMATATVVATGPATAFGQIAERLVVRPPETEFDRGARQFGVLIAQTVSFLVLFILMVNVALGHKPLESLLFAVALAVGLTPEFLPMITTVTLSMGAVQMARKHVIVKHLDAIENFGSIDVLQRQDRDAHGRRDDARPLARPVRDAERASAAPRIHQQLLRNRNQKPTGRGDLEDRQVRDRRMEQARRDPVRFRAPPSVDPCRERSDAHSDREGRAGEREGDLRFV